MLYLALPHRDRTNAISGIYNRLRIDIFDEISGERMIQKDFITNFKSTMPENFLQNVLQLIGV